MCLLFIAYRSHPDHPLVVAANRDEFHGRPASPAAPWADAPGVIAGRDREGGGTWLGIAPGGRFAAITNYREPGRAIADAPTRGHLVSGFLRCELPASDYLRQVARGASVYNGFSLVAFDGERLGWYSNRGEGVLDLESGIYGQSNHLLDTPWPKLARGRDAFTRALEAGPVDEAALLALLASRDRPVDSDLPETGVGREWERVLSTIFVEGDGYGTRCSTVVTVDADGAVGLVERSFGAGGEATGTVRHRLAPLTADSSP